MTANRVRLTEAAATRFPDLAGRTGTVIDGGSGSTIAWLHVAWPYRKGATPDDDVFTTVWLPREDLEPVPAPETTP